MSKHNPEGFNSDDSRVAAREAHAKDEAKEKRREALFGRMVGIARSVGGSFIENRALRYVEFNTWQDALDFQSFCTEEMEFPVRIEEPPRWAAQIQGHRVYPVFE